MSEIIDIAIPSEEPKLHNSNTPKNPDSNSECQNTENHVNNSNSHQEDNMFQEKVKRAAEPYCFEEEPIMKKKLTEYDKLMSAAEQDPSDFQAWTSLLQYVDQNENVEQGRIAYNKFFERYPYCYGYWKKYADLEKRNGTDETTLQVFNMGLEAIKLSVDLWVHFMEYLMDVHSSDHEFIRNNFAKGLECCGMDYKSDRLWEMRINWETKFERYDQVREVYDQLIAVNVSKYLQHWLKYKDFIGKHHPRDLLESCEYKSFVHQVALNQKKAADGSNSADELPPGDELAVADSVENDAEEEKLVRELYLAQRLKIHETTAAEYRALLSYEEAIKRPYFHVKPLEKSQLSAWRRYIDFMIKRGEQGKVKTLFERCLIATALYEEFWMRYLRYLEDVSAPDEERRDAFRRACLIHLPKKIRPSLAWAVFEEENGNAELALNILSKQQISNPKFIEPYMMAASVERRRGDLVAAQKIFADSFEKFKNEEDKQFFAALALKYARFLTYFMADAEKSIKVLTEAVDFDPTNSNLHLALADHAMLCRPANTGLAAEAFKKGAEKATNSNTKLIFAHRYLHFVTEFGSDPKSVGDAMKFVRDLQNEFKNLRVDNTNITTKNSDGADITGPKVSNPITTASSAATTTVSVSSDHPPSSVPPMNGSSISSGANNSVPPPTTNHYQNYPPNPNYNPAYNQQYSQNYSAPPYHQSWGYQNQQSGPNNYSGYNQNPWGQYTNYYGQR